MNSQRTSPVLRGSIKGISFILLSVGIVFNQSRSLAQLILDPPPLIAVPNVTLLPNLQDQILEIQITGGANVAGINFSLVLGDGYPDLEGSSVNGPVITGVDLVGSISSPTIFTGNNSGQQDPGSRDRAALRYLAIDSGSNPVSGNGRLALVTIDTTGYFSGTYELRVDGLIEAGFPSTELLHESGQTYNAEFQNGSIRLAAVPEPGAMALVSGLFCLFFILIRRSSCLSRTCLVVVMTLISVPLIGRAQTSVGIGNQFFDRDSKQLHVDLMVSGNDRLSGVNLIVEIQPWGDSGIHAPSPTLVEVDMEGRLVETIFSSNRTKQTSAEGRPWIRIESLTTQNGSVQAQGRLARLVFHTEGVPDGFYSVLIRDTMAGNTELLSEDASSVDVLLNNGLIELNGLLDPGLIPAKPKLIWDGSSGIVIYGTPNTLYHLQESSSLAFNPDTTLSKYLKFEDAEWQQRVSIPDKSHSTRFFRVVSVPSPSLETQ